MNYKVLAVVSLLSVVEVEPASILAVTSPSKAKLLQKYIDDHRKSLPESKNNVREFITLQNYLNNNMLEKVTLQDLTEAVVAGFTSAMLGRGMGAQGAIKVISMLFGSWFSLLPADLMTWVLGRELIVSDVVMVETIIQIGRGTDKN